MTQDQILNEMKILKEKAVAIEENFAAAAQSLDEAQKEIQAISDEATNSKLEIVSKTFSDELEKSFEIVKQQRALIRKLLFESVDSSFVNIATVEKNIGGYGTEESDLQNAAVLFESRFEDFLEEFRDEFSCQNRAVLKILNSSGEEVWNNFSALLKERNENLFNRLRFWIFTFDDIVHLKDMFVQRLLREIDTRELTQALKYASENVQNKIFNNMSKRAADMMREDIEFCYATQKDSREARRKILKTIFRLESRGDIIIKYPGEEN